MEWSCSGFFSGEQRKGIYAIKLQLTKLVFFGVLIFIPAQQSMFFTNTLETGAFWRWDILWRFAAAKIPKEQTKVVPKCWKLLLIPPSCVLQEIVFSTTAIYIGSVTISHSKRHTGPSDTLKTLKLPMKRYLLQYCINCSRYLHAFSFTRIFVLLSLQTRIEGHLCPNDLPTVGLISYLD